MRLRISLCAFLLLSGMLLSRRAKAYPVGPMPSLGAMTTQADVVVKVKAGATTGAQDPLFGAVMGYGVVATQCRVVSVLKGEIKVGASVLFVHYDEDAKASAIMYTYTPQFYHLEPGHSYLLFALKTPAGLRQLWPSHTFVMDAGAFQLADDKPVAGEENSAQALLRSEWSRMLSSPNADDVSYAIGHLAALTWPEFPSRDRRPDFDPKEVLARVTPLFSSPDARVAQAVMAAVARGSKSVTRFQDRFIAVADTHADIATRVLAIGYLSEVKTPQVEAAVRKWARSSSPLVQRAAVPLLGNFATADTLPLLRTLAHNSDAALREAAAMAMGRAQAPSLLDALELLLGDANEDVRRASAESLLLYPLKLSSPLLKRHLGDAGLEPNFVYALAKDNPQPYLSEIARLLSERTPSLPNFASQGMSPLYRLWDSLFNWLQAQPVAFRRSPEAKPLFEALEVEQNWGSSQAVSVYRLERQSGLEERAQAFRREREKNAGYNMSDYFKNADKEIADEELARAQAAPAP